MPSWPWDFVIVASTFGQEDDDTPKPLTFWWKLHVEHPACLKPSDRHEFVALTDGLTYEHPSSWKKGGGNAATDDYNKPHQPLAILDRGQVGDAP